MIYLSIYLGVALSFLTLGIACPFYKFLQKVLLQKKRRPKRFSKCGYWITLFGLLFLGTLLTLSGVYISQILCSTPSISLVYLWRGHISITVISVVFVLWSVILLESFCLENYIRKKLHKPHKEGLFNPVAVTAVLFSLACFSGIWTSRPNMIVALAMMAYLTVGTFLYTLCLVASEGKIWSRSIATSSALCILSIPGYHWVSPLFA